MRYYPRVVGDREYWGKGYGEEATRPLVDFAFSYVNLRSIMLEVFDFNARAICYDEILMDILAQEFEGAILKGLLPDLTESATE